MKKKKQDFPILKAYSSPIATKKIIHDKMIMMLLVSHKTSCYAEISSTVCLAFIYMLEVDEKLRIFVRKSHH